MSKRILTVILLGSLSILFSPLIHAENEPPSMSKRFAVGINYIGGQVRFHFNPRWALEGRLLTGQSSSETADVNAMVVGLRGYRFFKENQRLRFYGGLEADYAQTNIQDTHETNNANPLTLSSNFGNTSGYDVGGFGGIEYHISRRLVLDVDMGPYFINLKEKATSVSVSSWDFVVNTALCLYLF